EHHRCSPGKRGKRSAHRADRPGSPPHAALASLVKHARRVTTSTASARGRAGTGVPTPAPAAGAGRLPVFVEPQLATVVANAPPGDAWLHETKFDGYRTLRPGPQRPPPPRPPTPPAPPPPFPP